MKTLLALLAAAALTAPAAAQHAPPADTTATGILVPRYRNTASMAMRQAYPTLLFDAGVGGAVVATFLVRADSTVDTGSIRVESSDHTMFDQAVRDVLPRLRFVPLRRDGAAVTTPFRGRFTFRPDRASTVSAGAVRPD